LNYCDYLCDFASIFRISVKLVGLVGHVGMTKFSVDNLKINFN